jgi:hypothetical protein
MDVDAIVVVIASIVPNCVGNGIIEKDSIRIVDEGVIGNCRRTSCIKADAIDVVSGCIVGNDTEEGVSIATNPAYIVSTGIVGYYTEIALGKTDTTAGIVAEVISNYVGIGIREVYTIFDIEIALVIGDRVVIGIVEENSTAGIVVTGVICQGVGIGVNEIYTMVVISACVICGFSIADVVEANTRSGVYAGACENAITDDEMTSGVANVNAVTSSLIEINT